MSGCNCRPRRVYLPPKEQMTKAFLVWIIQSCGRELELFPLTEMKDAAAGDVTVLTSADLPVGLPLGQGVDCIADIKLQPGDSWQWRAFSDLFRTAVTVQTLRRAISVWLAEMRSHLKLLGLD